MTVSELLAILANLPGDAEVRAAYDGAARTEIGDAFLARSGDVVLASLDESLYYDDDRPPDAPDEEAEPYWQPRDRAAATP